MVKTIKNELSIVFRGADKNTVIAVVYITFALACYYYFGIQDFFVKMFGSHFSNADTLLYYKYIYHNFMAFVFFFVLSIPVVKLVTKQKFADIGLNFKEKKLNIKIILLALVIAPIVSLSAVGDPQMKALYPLSGELVFASAKYFLLYYLSLLAYYFGWEYMFRGFGFFNMSSRYGPALAIAFSTMISALVHSSIAGFGKPMTETFSAVFGGFILGFIAYKSKSIFPSMAVHFLLGFSLDMYTKLF